MRRSSWIGLGTALVFLLAAGGWFLLRGGTPPTPEMLITESLNDAEQAARKRNLSGMMEIVSNDFRAAGMKRDHIRLRLLQVLRQSRGVSYDVQVTKPRIFPSPEGDTKKRLVISRLSVFYNDSGETIWGSNEPLVFVMREETRRKYLFLKEPRWRIVGVANMPPILGGDDSGGGSFGGLL